MCKKIISKLETKLTDQKFGVVISTFNAVPYIHLQLEVRKLFYPNTPTLIIDDNSLFKDVLKELANIYEVSFYSRKERLGHTNGDLDSFVNAIDWGVRRELDYMVKISRRLIINKSWIENLNILIKQTGFKATYTRDEPYYKFPMRTELVALKVEAWKKIRKNIAEDKTQAFSPTNKKGKFAEFFLFELAKSLGQIEEWDLLSETRRKPKSGVLWHEAGGWYPYFELSRKLGLDYSPEDFQNVNEIEGHKY